jgi:hypothetical protein
MSRRKNSSQQIHVYLKLAAFEALHAEARRLETRPGKLLSRIILERSETFLCKPVELVAKR